MGNIDSFMRWYIENRQRFEIIIPNLINLNPRWGNSIRRKRVAKLPVCWEENVPCTLVCGQCTQRSASINCAWRLPKTCPLCRFEGSPHLKPPRGLGRGILDPRPPPPRGQGRGILGQLPPPPRGPGRGILNLRPPPPRGRGRGILGQLPPPPRGQGRGILGQWPPPPRGNRWYLIEIDELVFSNYNLLEFVLNEFFQNF